MSTSSVIRLAELFHHYAWRDAIVPVAHRPAGGPMDVYAVFAAPGVGLRELAFVMGE
jgi:hypothetical protein